MNTGLLRYAVGTVLTVYGIETMPLASKTALTSSTVGTVLTVYGIETSRQLQVGDRVAVGTVLTVYGIETGFSM